MLPSLEPQGPVTGGAWPGTPWAEAGSGPGWVRSKLEYPSHPPPLSCHLKHTEGQDQPQGASWEARVGVQSRTDEWALLCSWGRWDTPGLAERRGPCPYRAGAAGTMVRGQLCSGTHSPVDSVASSIQGDSLTPASHGLLFYGKGNQSTPLSSLSRPQSR